jgi:hypothetical protein
MFVGAWQLVLGLLDQILFIKINLSKLSVYSLHHHKFVRTPTKEEIHSISIGDPSILNICHTSEATIKNMISCFFHHWRGHLMSLMSNCHHQNDHNSQFTFFCQFTTRVCYVKYVQARPDMSLSWN